MKRPLNSTVLWRVVPACALAVLLGSGMIWMAPGQNNQLGVGKDFTFPDYYPATNGAVRLRSVITGKEYRFLSNNVLIALTHPRIEYFREDGTMEWSAIAGEATVDVNTREVRGNTNLFFRTSDDRLFLSGVGFLWQPTNSVLMLSNKTFTWIDTRQLTNSSSKGPTSKMKTLVAVSLVATAKLTAAEMEIPPTRPGLTITAGVHWINLGRSESETVYSNNVFVTYPSAKSNEPPTYLRCDWGTAKQGANHQIAEIAAHGRVAIDQGDRHARGNFALYTATNEIMALVGRFDPADSSRPRPYLYASQQTNGVEIVQWLEDGDAILYDRTRNRLTVPNPTTTVATDQLKSFSPTDRVSTNSSRPKDADRPKKASPPTN